MVESKSSLGIAILAQFRKLKKVSPILVSASHLLPDANAVILRSEPSSRTAFMGEQPNPWDVLPPQDAMSRHRLYFKYKNKLSFKVYMKKFQVERV